MFEPPYILRPTTRLAKVTGMRRWPWSTKTIRTNRARDTNRMTENLIRPPSWRTVFRPDGMPATTLAKIRMDIPWPMPRWVISSASHITKAVPAVRVITMNAARQME